MFNNVYGCSICFNVMRSFVVARSGLVDYVGFSDVDGKTRIYFDKLV